MAFDPASYPAEIAWLTAHGVEKGAYKPGFCGDMLQRAYKRQGWTPNQLAAIQRGVLRDAAKAPAKPVAPAAPALNLAPIQGLFTAWAQKLDRPGVLLDAADDGILRLALAGPKAQLQGAIVVTDNQGYGGTFFGRILPNGDWRPANGRVVPLGVTAALVAFAADPVGVAAAYGHKIGACCFCSRKLTDARSVEVGYGPDCADQRGMPYPAKAKKAKVSTLACAEAHP